MTISKKEVSLKEDQSTKMTILENEVFLTEYQLANLLHVERTTISNWVRRGKIPKCAIFRITKGRRGTIRFITEEIKKWFLGGFTNDSI